MGEPPAPGSEGTDAVWEVRDARLTLARPLVMGILNLTPDSFSDGGRFTTAAEAVAAGMRMVDEGADLIDVGGESTRPGARAVEPALQAERVVPVIEGLSARAGVPVSVDTRSAEVARLALDAGASIVNDVSGLADPAMATVACEAGAGVVLMHMRGTPETMQSLAVYDDVVGEVVAELRAACARAVGAGVQPRRIVLDPGIGFAKTTEHNLTLMAALERVLVLGRPLLVGPSRKAFIGQVLGGIPPHERLAGTIAACVAALQRGARLFRVHDVAPVRQALDVAEAIRRSAPEER